jgi:hypothetical protein
MISRSALLFLSFGLTGLLVATSANATQVRRETDVTNLRLGERILVDDGSCPAGQIKEISGAKLGPTGVVRVRKCVARKR